jgi:hypothetical protein
LVIPCLSSGDKKEEPSNEEILFLGLHGVTSDWTRESTSE